MMDGVSLEQLSAFIAAADAGSFSAAGRRLKRAQSVISQTVSNLEGQLGVRLFDRTARPPVLTDQGRVLLASARTVISQMDLLKARAKGLAGGWESELTAGVDSMFPIAMFTAAMGALRERFPETAPRLYVDSWRAVVQHVLDRRCAIAIVVSQKSTPRQLACEHLMTVKMAIVVSPQHPLAIHRGPIPRSILTRHIQLLHTDASDRPAGRESGVLSPKTWPLAQIEAKLAFLRAGFGFGGLPLHVVERDLASGTLVQIGVEDSPLCAHALEISALYRKDRRLGPAARWLIDRLKQVDGQQLGIAGVSPSSARPQSARSGLVRGSKQRT